MIKFLVWKSQQNIFTNRWIYIIRHWQETDYLLSLIYINKHTSFLLIVIYFQLSESKIQEESGSESCEEEETLGWLKYSTIASPWDESKDPLLLKSEFIPTETDGVLTKEMISSGSSNIDQLPDTKAFVLTRLQLSDKVLHLVIDVYKSNCILQLQ